MPASIASFTYQHVRSCVHTVRGWISHMCACVLCSTRVCVDNCDDAACSEEKGSADICVAESSPLSHDKRMTFACSPILLCWAGFSPNSVRHRGCISESKYQRQKLRAQHIIINQHFFRYRNVFWMIRCWWFAYRSVDSSELFTSHRTNVPRRTML